VSIEHDLHRYADAQQLAEALAGALARDLAAAVQQRGSASLVVSGGSTPLPLFRLLRQMPLPWEHITITLADERWVDPQDAASNERLLRQELLRDAAARAQFIPLKNDAPTPASGAARAWSALQAVPRPFDVVLLGMGDDGHTASLFPGSPGIDAALAAEAAPGCVAMRAPVPPMARLSLNAAALLQTRQLYLHFTGEAKWQVWARAADLPVGLTLRRAVSRPQLYGSP
jgi:6-phosphogluconolactonase